MISGYQAVYDQDFPDAIRYAGDNEFEYVSFDLNVPRFYIDHLSDVELAKIRSQAESMGVGLAFHAPGDNISLYTDYPPIRRGIIEHFSSIIRAAGKLDARHVTIHAGICPSLRQVHRKQDDFAEDHRDYFRAVLYDNISCLAEQVQSVLLCIENCNFTRLTMDTVEKLLSDNERLALTWDIAKTYDRELRRDEDVEDFMWKHCDRIREVHAHDIIKGGRSHQVVGEGGLEFVRYAPVLLRPDVAVTFEVRPREAALKSRRLMLCMLDQKPVTAESD
jgi:sugar phosphate isomerase/epimerase